MMKHWCIVLLIVVLLMISAAGLYILASAILPSPTNAVVSTAGCLNEDFSLSPNGQHIVFTATGDSLTSIYAGNIDGSDWRQLTAGEHPQWSPDGNWIVYDRTENESSTVHRIRPDGTQETWLGDGASPQWSPIFSASSHLTPVLLLGVTAGILKWAIRRRVKLYRLSGCLLSAFLLLVSGELMLIRLQPPQAPWISFISEADTGWQLQRIRSDGRESENLTALEGQESLHLWTGKGNGIVVTDDDGVYYLNPATAKTRLLAQANGFDALSRSPDGDLTLEMHRRIYEMPLDEPDLEFRLAGSGSSWSPDGRWLAFAQGQALYVRDENLNEVVSLTDLPGYIHQSGWTPDGQWLVVVQNQRTILNSRMIDSSRMKQDYVDWSEIYRVHPDGTDLQRIVASDPSLCSMMSQRVVP